MNSNNNGQKAPSSKGNTWKDQENAFFGNDEPKKKAASPFRSASHGHHNGSISSSSSSSSYAVGKHNGNLKTTTSTAGNETKDAIHRSISSGTKKLTSQVSKWATSKQHQHQRTSNTTNNYSTHNSNTTFNSTNNNNNNNNSHPSTTVVSRKATKGRRGIFGGAYPATRRNIIAQKPPPSSSSTRTTTTGVASYPPNSPHAQYPTTTSNTCIQVPKQNNKNNSSSTNSKKDHSNTKRFLKNALLSQVPLRCIHCHAIPLMYKSHPFFGPIQRVCSTHDEQSLSKCVSCKRYQPKNSPFVPVNSDDRHLLICKTCQPTAVMDMSFTSALFVQVLEFFRFNRLDLWRGTMEKIPIHLVNESVLQGLHPNHYGSEGIKGLCLYSINRLMFGSTDLLQAGSNAMNFLQKFSQRNPTAKSTLAKLRRLRNGSNAGKANSGNIQGGVGGEEDRGLAPRAGVSINYILCLKGLPANYTSAVLAHEATHAWLGLNPANDYNPPGSSPPSLGQRRLSPKVEEGCCQLVSYLYLAYLLETDLGTTSSISMSSSSSSWGEPSEKQLVQFFQWCIENDTSTVYGDGFRLAKKSYSHYISCGYGDLRDFLDHVCRNRAFPAC